jgi:hypothetical protein
MSFRERPHLLSAPNIPKPLHGLNPRSIMGVRKWNEVRRDVYQSTCNRCSACGVHKSDAKLHKWMEAHEIFSINYRAGLANLIEIVPLCHYCHSFIHSGLLRVKARKREVSASHVRAVMRHGCCVLLRGDTGIFSGTAELCDLVSIDRGLIPVMPETKVMADWSKWRMRWNGVEYKGKYNSLSDWERSYK